MAERAEKSSRTAARLPRGLVDRSPEDIRATEQMMAKIRAVYELYGFEPVETPLIEYTDALGKFLPDQDRPNEGVFSFQDDDEQWLSLRYDLTAPLARYVAENYERLPKPYRGYRAGWVFRNEKPGPGRFRQFMQFDADTVGTPGVAADAEMAMMMADVMEALGIPRGQYVIRVNNRKVLDGVLEAIGLGGDENAGRRLSVLRAIDKLDKFGLEGVRLLLGPGRWDGGKEGEGDFTKGAGLDEGQVDRVLSDIGVSVAEEETYPASGLFTAGLGELQQIDDLVRAAGYGPDRIRIDPSVVRGLEYYTGPVYEAELLAEIPNEDGVVVRFGSVGGGGRYDGLVSRFRGEPVPATGFSIGVSRLMTALKNLGKLESSTASGPVVVLVMDKDTDSLGRYQKMVADLRQAGIRAEMYLGGSGMKAQMKYADRRGSPCVVIQGGDELAAGTVQIKDLVVGARLAAEIAGHEAYKEARPGQITVPSADLVAEVQKILDAQKAERGSGRDAPMIRTPAVAETILAVFAERGAELVDVPVLQPADPFLDMAGEDLRRRIFLTESETGETLCLRPEFTIPVCLDHIATRAGTPRRYAYLGEVFRQRREGGNEFFQGGIEDLGEQDTAHADARSLADAHAVLAAALFGKQLTVTLGDQALFEAVLAALGLPRGWRMRLARAFGSEEMLSAALADLANPQRNGAMPGAVAALVADGDQDGLAAHVAGEMRAAGLSENIGRSPREIARRLMEKAELRSVRLSDEAFSALRRFLAIHVPLDRAADALGGFAADAGLALGAAFDGFARRAEAIADFGLPPGEILYDAAFGRPLDYYTGLVFEIGVAGAERPLAGGGRYDRLLTLLGAEKPIPGVGFSIWLDRIVALREAGA